MTYDWQTTFARALHNLGDAPGAQLENDLRAAFETHPQAVTNAITKIIEAHKAGRIRSPWGALKAEVPKQIDRETIVDDRTEQRTAVQRAEQWIRNAGLHCPSWDEALGELQRRENLDLNPATRTRLYELWLEQQPVAAQIDADAQHRADEWKASREALAAHPKPEPAAA